MPVAAAMLMPQPEADRLVQAAAVEINGGRAAAAASLLDQALQSDPNHLMALTMHAQLALSHKDHAGALRLTDAVLAAEPNFAPALGHRSAALWMAGRKPEAIIAIRSAMQVQPQNVELRLRLAQFTAWTGQADEATACLQPILCAKQRDPGAYAAAVAMLGEIAIAGGRFEQALPHLDQALRIDPNLEVTRMLRGMTMLRLGRFREGWDDYAVRETIRQLYPDAPKRRADEVWRGQDLAGRTLLVTDDQGNGDAIQFFRYVPMLRERGAADITWQTFSPLVRLFAASEPGISVVDSIPQAAWFDFETTSTSLPRACGTELNTIPTPIPYLHPPDRLGASLRLPAGRTPKVGLVWSGDPRHTRDHLRSIPAEIFLTLARVPGLSFHSLQHPIRPTDRQAVEARPRIGRAVENATDFADTAAIIARLDLVIAVDTATAHLAGALGKPVWVILHVVPDWRWLVERPDSPWYPNMTLFRVTAEESQLGWGPVIDRVTRQLRAFARR